MNRTQIISDGKNQNHQLRCLLSLHDVEFVKQSYFYVLGREADPEGLEYSVSRIRAGFCKLTVLNEMRRSSEGRKVSKSLEKLDRLLCFHQICNLPFLGIIFRIFKSYESDAASERQSRAILNELGRLRSDLADLASIRSGTAPDIFSISGLSEVSNQSAKQFVMSSLGPRERQIFSRLTAQIAI
jgi:hypothetical protein